MDYHLCQSGKNVGVFSIEELRRRRQQGLLAGAELVWREGMDQWRALDEILSSQSAVATPPPVPAASRAKMSGTGLLTAAVVVLAALVLAGGAIFFGDKFKEMLQQRRVATVTPKQTNLRFVINATNLFNAGQARSRTGNWPEYALGQPMSRQNYELGSRPIPEAPKSRTQNDVRQAQRKFRELVWVEGYKENGQRKNPKVDAAALEFLQSWLEANYGDGSKIMSNVVAQAQQLAANPDCTDPLVLSAVAAVSKPEEGIRLYERALQLFPQSKHKAYGPLFATLSLATLQSQQFQSHPLDAEALRFAERAFADGSFPVEHEEAVADIFLDQWAQSFLQRNSAALYPLAAGKPSGEWLALLLEGEHHINAGWQARGSGFGNTVNQAGWTGFESELQAASDRLSKAWSLRRDLPHASSRMIAVCMGLGRPDEMRAWFERAVVAQIDYPGAWASFRWALRPRWYGGHGTLLALGQAAVGTARFDTDAPRQLMDILGDIESELPRIGENLYERPEVWPYIQRMYEGYLGEPSQNTMGDAWKSSYLLAAYRGKKYDIARAQLEKINWTLAAQYESARVDPAIFPLEIAARTGPAGAEVNRAETLRDQGDFKGALQVYSSLDKQAGLEERSRQFIGLRLAALAVEERLQSGDWVSLLTSGDNRQLWNIVRGSARPASGAALELAGNAGHLAFARARTGPNFELRGEFEVISAGGGAQMGLVFGEPFAANCNLLAFQIKRAPSGLMQATYKHLRNSEREISPTVKLKDGVNSFTFQHVKSRTQVSLNGQQVLSGFPDPGMVDFPAAEQCIGLGWWNPAGNSTPGLVVRYRNIQIRRLTTSPDNGLTEINISLPR